MEYTPKTVQRLSVLTYSGLSVGASLFFMAAAKLIGGYPSVAVYGGAVWVMLLSFIITMPIVTSGFKKRLLAQEEKK